MPIRDIDVPRVLERLGIEATRKGRELWARCPFHDERTPSWRVRDEPTSDKHALWQCFGACPADRRSGSIVSLVRSLLGLDSREDAWRWIKEQNAEVQRPTASRVELSIIEPAAPFALPSSVRVCPVDRWVTPARDYLVTERGVPPEQAERWGLGFAPQGRLAGRIVFPIRDQFGRVLSYTARTYLGHSKKFLEPEKDERADKGSVFGEQHWPPPATRRVVIALEAAFDALAVERVLSTPVAAIYGSELLPGHLARLSTFPRIVVASDPDPAGEKLYEQIKRQLGRWSNVVRARLPDGYDASRLAKIDPEQLACRLRPLLQ